MGDNLQNIDIALKRIGNQLNSFDYDPAIISSQMKTIEMILNSISIQMQSRPAIKPFQRPLAPIGVPQTQIKPFQRPLTAIGFQPQIQQVQPVQLMQPVQRPDNFIPEFKGPLTPLQQYHRVLQHKNYTTTEKAATSTLLTLGKQNEKQNEKRNEKRKGKRNIDSL